jgi:hypothetical protein
VKKRIPLGIRKQFLKLIKWLGLWTPPQVRLTITLLAVLLMVNVGFSDIPMDLHYVQFYWPQPAYTHDAWLFVIDGDSIRIDSSQVDFVGNELHCVIDTVNSDRFQYLQEYDVSVYGIINNQISTTSFDFPFLFLPGDFNEDNAVNGADYATFPPPGPFGRSGVDYRVFQDLTRDGNVYGNDVYEFSKFFGRTYVPSY